MKITWDPAKREKVLADHRVDFDKIGDVFLDPYSFEYTDEEHSDESELRFGIIGFTREYGLIHLIFTEPTDEQIHVVTARRAERWMVQLYDKERSRI